MRKWEVGNRKWEVGIEENSEVGMRKSEKKEDEKVGR
jgi:hypothetical protein